MPSHSPYALSNLTFVKLILDVYIFLNYIRIRDCLKLNFLPLHISMLGKTFNFPHFFDNLSIIGVCLNHLIKTPRFLSIIVCFALFSFQGTTSYWMCHFRDWWRWGGSNSWPPACKAGALPAELHPQISVDAASASACRTTVLPSPRFLAWTKIPSF